MIGKKFTVHGLQSTVKSHISSPGAVANRRLSPVNTQLTRGFTLVETLAAITLIMVAIVAPMALTVQSLSAAYYARDQITASNLAQEGIEDVRVLRDANVLLTAEGTQTNIFNGIIPSSQSGAYTFTIDGKTGTIAACSGTCTALTTDGTFYGYGLTTPTNFVRTLVANVVWSTGGYPQEVNLTSTVTWKTSAFKTQQVQISENLYNWAPSS